MSRFIFLISLLVSCLCFHTAAYGAVRKKGDNRTLSADTVRQSDAVFVAQGDTAYLQGIKVEPAEEEETNPKAKGPVYQGAYIGVDVFDPLLTLFNGGRFQFEISADVALWHTLFPVVEFGMMYYNPSSDAYSYSTNGFFLKAGAGYNLINNNLSRRFDHMVAVGVRYGYSNVSYKLSDASVHDNYWQTDDVVSSSWQNANVGWLEFVATVRVQIYKSFFMGLSARVQTFSHIYGEKMTYPTYVPGFGVYADGITNWNFDLAFYYQFPYKKKKN